MGVSGGVCTKSSLSKSLDVLAYGFFKLLGRREKALSYAWKAKMDH